MSAFLRILRPKNLAFLAFAMLGFILCGLQLEETVYEPGKNSLLFPTLLILIVCTVAASGNVINDIYDVKADRINKPQKTFVGKSLSYKNAFLLYSALSIVSLISSSLLAWISGLGCIVVAVLVVEMLLFLYARFLKKTMLLGNLLIANLTALPYALILYAFGWSVENTIFKFVFFSLMFFVLTLNLIREVAKDWEDVAGDLVLGAKTFPIKFGAHATRTLLLVLIFFSMILHFVVGLTWIALVGVLRGILINWPLIVLGILHIHFLVALKKSTWTPSRLSSRLKLLMLLGVCWIYYLWIILQVNPHNIY
jgi:4-hydroxybenzoate polyprenyltransferase